MSVMQLMSLLGWCLNMAIKPTPKTCLNYPFLPCDCDMPLEMVWT